MKRLLITLMTLAMLLSLAACGGSGNGSQTPDDPPAAGDNNAPASGPEGSGQTEMEIGDPADVPDEDGADDPGEEDPGEAPAAPDDSTPADADPAGPGDATDPAEEEAPAGGDTDAQPPETDPEPTTDPEPEADPEPAEPADLKALAESLIGHPVSELYDAIGEPLAADYSPSCLNLDTDDGELTYDGFVVYTEGAPDNETVYAVL